MYELRRKIKNEYENENKNNLGTRKRGEKVQKITYGARSTRDKRRPDNKNEYTNEGDKATHDVSLT